MGKRGDEDVLPMLTPRSSRPASSPVRRRRVKGQSQRNYSPHHRPNSAPGIRAESRVSQMSLEEDGDVRTLREKEREERWGRERRR